MVGETARKMVKENQTELKVPTTFICKNSYNLTEWISLYPGR